MINRIKAYVELHKQEMIDRSMELCRIPGINPRMGGEGERLRVNWLEAYLEKKGIAYEEYNAEDPISPDGKRPSVIVILPADKPTEKTLWFVGHLDTVATGDLNTWNTDPFDPVLTEDRIYGMGVEDNGQAVVSMLLMLNAIRDLDLHPTCNIGFLFVADEETGSHFGLQAMMRDLDIFHSCDEAIVPDAGHADGSFVEISEKSVLWLRYTVLGQQTHGSRPHLGINAGYVGSKLGVELSDTLSERFGAINDIFDPPYSTFSYTQKLANVDGINVIAGKDEFAMDMRVLPEYPLDDILAVIDEICSRYENEYGVKISYETAQRADAAPTTEKDSKIASALMDTLSEIGVQGRFVGIGAATCGAILRRAGIRSVVWSTLDEMAHHPNEYAKIANMVQDTVVFLRIIERYCD